MRAKTITRDQRQHLAQVAARIMVQEGISDFQLAKVKAATQLGMPNTRHLPNNSEIEAEILIYQRLFHADTYVSNLQQQRQTALEAMRLLATFNPRLVGEVLQGTAHVNSIITLHLFIDNQEEIALFLINKNIPYEISEKRFRLSQIVTYPCYRFIAGKHAISLVVFKSNDIRWSPPSPVDGKPMRRADMRTVENLLTDQLK